MKDLADLRFHQSGLSSRTDDSKPYLVNQKDGDENGDSWSQVSVLVELGDGDDYQVMQYWVHNIK